MPCMVFFVPLIFLSTPSARRATGRLGAGWRGMRNFYPRPPRGGRRPRRQSREKNQRFLSTPSARRATCTNPNVFVMNEFLSTPSARRATLPLSEGTAKPMYFYPRPPRGGRPGHLPRRFYGVGISIHALREEGDIPHRRYSPSRFHFYPRPPRGGRPTAEAILEDGYEFLSTPSARRATMPGTRSIRRMRNFYPRPPRGGRPGHLPRRFYGVGISIHALREEGDIPHRRYSPSRFHFYPRPPRGGRPSQSRRPPRRRYFYPRPPRGGRRRRSPSGRCCGYFYPRPPRGGRPDDGVDKGKLGQFLSTPSARRATDQKPQDHVGTGNFYPRPPRGGRLAGEIDLRGLSPISIHALREEGDWALALGNLAVHIFLSTPSARRATVDKYLPKKGYS